MNRYPANQLAQLVRTPRLASMVGAVYPSNGAMVPGPRLGPVYPWHRPSGGGNPPGLPPPVAYTPPGASVGDCGPCGPINCPPVDPAFAAAAAAMQCQQDSAMYQRASRARLLSQLPQSPVGVSSDSRVPGSTAATGTNGAVGAGLTHTIQVTSSVPICITDLEVSRVATPFFWISSIRFAQREFMADGGSHADAWAPDSNHPLMEFPTLYPGTVMSFTVINLDGAERQFYATFSGIVLGGSTPCL